MDTNELNRLILNLVRKGKILEVNHQAATCRVQSGDLQTNWIRWLVFAAGQTRDWNPPTPGEQVLLLCPCGDPADAVALRGIYSDDAPAPSSSPNTHSRIYPDGAKLEYDHAAHKMDAVFPSRSVLNLVAPSAVNVDSSSVTTTGNVSVGTGASGSFTTPTGQIVTVMDGVVINIT